MKLADYLIKYDISPSAFARRARVRSRTTIHRYLKGQRRPSPEVILRIEKITKGEVTRKDFFQLRCRNDSQDSLFPWSRFAEEYFRQIDADFKNMLEEPPEGDLASPPLREALMILGSRVSYDKSQRNFWLDGRPSEPKQIVMQANRILTSIGKEPISYPLVNPKVG